MNLNECKVEMRNIVRELRDIEWGVKRDFSNIGQDLCGNCIGNIAGRYENVSRQLDSVSQNLISTLVNIFKQGV